MGEIILFSLSGHTGLSCPDKEQNYSSYDGTPSVRVMASPLNQNIISLRKLSPLCRPISNIHMFNIDHLLIVNYFQNVSVILYICLFISRLFWWGS